MRPGLHLLTLCLLLGTFVLVGGGCSEHANPAIAADLAVGTPIGLGTPVTVTLTIAARADIKGVDAGLNMNGPGIRGQHEVAFWKLGDVVDGQRVTVSTPVTFTLPGEYQLVAGVHTLRGSYNATSMRIYVDQNGAVINPTPWPAGVPARVAAAVTGYSPIATATSRAGLRPGSASPLATPTARPIPPDSNPSASVTLTMLGPAIPGQPVTVVADIRSRTELRSPHFSVAVQQASTGVVTGRVYSATLSTLLPGETRLVTQTLTLPSKDGSYAIVAFVATGPSYAGALYFAITDDSFVANPTPWPPGVPAPVERIETPRATAPTRTPAPSISITASR